MMTKRISKLITYLSILQETLKQKEDTGSKYQDVDILFDDDFIIKEKWNGGETDLFHTIEFPIRDIDSRIKSARSHLRYLKKRTNGCRQGD